MIASAVRLVVLALLLSAYALVLAGRVHADDDQELVRAHMAVCAGEAGWDPSTGDCAAIVHLIARRAAARGWDRLEMLRAYSSRHFDGDRQDRRRWIAGLDVRCVRPEGWPPHLSWRRHVARCKALVTHVRAVLRGDVEDPCPGSSHWGGAMDDWRAEAAGWERVECSEPTRNRFWRVPQLHHSSRPPRNGASLEEVAEQFGVTRERIRQLEARALWRLRKVLRLRGIADDVATQLGWSSAGEAEARASGRVA